MLHLLGIFLVCLFFKDTSLIATFIYLEKRAEIVKGNGNGKENEKENGNGKENENEKESEREKENESGRKTRSGTGKRMKKMHMNEENLKENYERKKLLTRRLVKENVFYPRSLTFVG